MVNMWDRTATDIIARAMRAAGVAVHEIERRTHCRESDLIRLCHDYYVALDYESFEQGGIIQIPLCSGRNTLNN